MTKPLLFAIIALLIFQSCQQPKKASNKKPVPEIMYHVFQRSFYDSNGDLQGDLNGLRQKLDYLQDLGVTSILMVPLYESVFYHNYFSNDFKKIDAEYGTFDDYLALVKDIHNRGMKIYMDMETQYVTENHPWYKDSFKNPASPYSDYILYQDSAQSKPSTIVADLTGLKGFDGTYRTITTVNLLNDEVLEYNYELFNFWDDPNKDGNFEDGVDGFRLDHMMDSLDYKPQLGNLFEKFWNPLLSRLKEVNPKLTMIAEQAEWTSFGIDYLTEANIDRVFAFRLMGAIRNLDKNEIVNMADSTFMLTPEGKEQIVFISNHDIPRFASVVGKSLPKQKVGAALNLLIGGVPSIYYGQEIGMFGGGRWGLFGGVTDANEIPEREAFEWYKSDTGKGMALWYKNSGPWWDDRNNAPNDGVSLEEQKSDKNSLWNYYKTLIQLRKNNACLGFGKHQNLKNNNPDVYTFLRYTDSDAVVVAVNLSDSAQTVKVDLSAFPVKIAQKTAKILLGTAKINQDAGILSFKMNGFAVQVIGFE